MQWNTFDFFFCSSYSFSWFKIALFLFFFLSSFFRLLPWLSYFDADQTGVVLTVIVSSEFHHTNRMGPKGRGVEWFCIAKCGTSAIVDGCVRSSLLITTRNCPFFVWSDRKLCGVINDFRCIAIFMLPQGVWIIYVNFLFNSTSLPVGHRPQMTTLLVISAVNVMKIKLSVMM